MRSHSIDSKIWFEFVELLNSGRYDQVISAANSLLKKNARVPELWELAGTALLRKGDLKNAEKHLKKSLKINPSRASAHFNLASIYFEGSQFEAAANAFARYLKQKPTDRTALLRFGQALLNSNQAERSKAYFEALARSDSQNPIVWFVLAQSYKSIGQVSDALNSYRTAIEMDSEFKEAWFNLGNLYRDIDNNSEALSCFKKSLSLRPGHVPTLLNFAHCYIQQGDLDTALSWIDKAIEADPGNPEPQFARSIPLFLSGRLKEGFAAAETRTGLAAEYKRLYRGAQPDWDGTSSLVDKHLVIYAEQGFGDTLMMLRFLKFLDPSRTRVSLIVQHELSTLVAKNFPQIDVHEFSKPKQVRLEDSLGGDYQCSLMSLAYLTRSMWSTPPKSKSYLKATEENVAAWTEKIGGGNKRRVGIVWRGNATHKNDHNRSVGVDLFLNGLCPDHTYFLLQKDITRTERQRMESHRSLDIIAPELGDFSDTAGLCMNLDSVVSVDTSVAHLAGSLGLPTFVLLPKNPDWRWGLGTDDSCWYPTMQLFRQTRLGQWDETVIRAMKHIGTD